MRIKVTSIVSTLERSGPTSVLFNLLKNMDNAFENSIITLSPEPTSSRLKDFRELGISIHQLNLNRWRWFLHGSRYLVKTVGEIAPQIVHTHSLRPDIISASRLSAWRRVTTIHGNLQAAYRDSYGSRLGTTFASRQLGAISRLEKKIACSRSVYNLYASIIPDLECIPNGVDVNIFHPVRHEQQVAIRKVLDLPQDKTLFITAGALTNLKDPHTVVEGFLKSNIQHNAILVVLGAGPLENKIKAACARNNIYFRGFVENVNDYYKASDYFISASTSEGLPNAALEAMACGLAVCLSDIEPHKELFASSSPGKLFKVGSAEALANAIDLLTMENYDARYNDDAVEIISSMYSAKIMAKKYERIYSSFF